MKQTSLFNVTKKKQSPSDNSKATSPSKESWIPKVGDEVYIMNLNDGIEGIIEYIDQPNLYNDWLYPIQLNVPKLNSLMFRTGLKSIKKMEESK